jgi:hypothetical protein
LERGEIYDINREGEAKGKRGVGGTAGRVTKIEPRRMRR